MLGCEGVADLASGGPAVPVRLWTVGACVVVLLCVEGVGIVPKMARDGPLRVSTTDVDQVGAAHLTRIRWSLTCSAPPRSESTRVSVQVWATSTGTKEASRYTMPTTTNARGPQGPLVTSPHESATSKGGATTSLKTSNSTLAFAITTLVEASAENTRSNWRFFI